MSGNKCSYYRCGKSSRDNPGLRKFSFPIRNPERCQAWIVNSGNSGLLDLSPSSLKNKFLCGFHFKPEDLLKKNITSTAVPVKCSIFEAIQQVNTKYEEPSATYASASYDNPIPSTSGVTREMLKSGECHIISPPQKKKKSVSPATTASICSDWDDDIFPLQQKTTQSLHLTLGDTPRKKRLKTRIIALRKKLRSKTSMLSQVKKDKKVSQQKKIGFTPRDLKSLPTVPRALVRMQLYHKTRMPFSKDEKKVAVTLFYKSPGLYRFLRRNKVVLPSESAVKMWITDFNAKAGFDKVLFNRIKQKASTMIPSEKKCILMFDEMDMKQFLDYSRKMDIIEGFEDLGQFGRRPVLAKKVLVLMVRGVYAQWKLPIAYFFSEKPVGADNLKKIIQTALETIEETSLKPIATVCDQSTTNQRLYKLFNVSVANPFFFVNGKKYYALFDVPHLIKSIRNNLLNGYFIYGNKIVSMEAIRKLVELDRKSSTGKALPKITDKHLHPNTFQKMNVKLAAQILSHSVSAGLKTAVRTKELHPSALDTAEFIEQIDRLFDSLNSQKLYAEKACNSALSNANTYAQDALQDGFKLFTTLVKQDPKSGNLSRPPCFNGMLQTINAVNSIFTDSVTDGYTFLFTRRLNQDPLENQFSLYRQSGGYNRNPTARTFKAAFKMSVTINLIKPPHSNCEEDEDNILQYQDSDKDNENVSTSSVSSSVSSMESITLSNDGENKVFSLEKSSVLYFGGYLFKKLIDKYKCDLCREFLQGELNVELDENESLIFFKNYSIEKSSFSRLKVPSPILKAFTEVSMRYFANYFKKCLTKRGFGKSIENIIIQKLHTILPDWFVQNECKEHREFILKLLIRTLIFKECKNFSLNIKSDETAKTSKTVTKLTILKRK